MMAKIVELQQNRNLIRSNFDGYKLSLDVIPILRRKLQVAPNKEQPNDEQYSFLHTELFAMQNLLQVDPWLRTTAYFVNKFGEVVRSCYDETIGQPKDPQVVFRLNDQNGRQHKGEYNYSLRFISEKYCVLCDGKQQLHLLDTGDRLKTEWKEIAKHYIKTKEENERENFMLFDCRLDILQEQKQISIALGTVERIKEDDDNYNQYLILHWAKWTLKDVWIFEIAETIEGKGSLFYCGFEPRSQSLVISSNKQFEFRSVKARRPNLKNNSELGDENSAYTWSQTNDEVSIKFDIVKGLEEHYSVNCTATKLCVKCSSDVLLDNELFSNVVEELTTWAIENNQLQITLIKQTSVNQASLRWPSLLVNNCGPKESIENMENGNTNYQPREEVSDLNLEAPIEDCDFPMGPSEIDIKIERFHLPTKSITHVVLLGSHPPLFTTNLRPGFPLAVVTRQGVDACLWLQQYNPNKPDEWSLRHEGNLHAFAYVQASKQQRKFTECSPDLSYALVCESHRHIYIYKSNYEGTSGLRNRNGPQITLGKQHLITLEDSDEVLGVATSNNVITVLTENNLLYIQIN